MYMFVSVRSVAVAINAYVAVLVHFAAGIELLALVTLLGVSMIFT
jgi:hypothetical protein